VLFSRLLTAFDAFDEDGSGRLDKGEFRDILQGTGLGGGELSDEDFARVMVEVDKDGSGDIDTDEVSRRRKRKNRLHTLERLRTFDASCFVSKVSF
jgi:Ca2+-binding EF-hand superfamily protein